MNDTIYTIPEVARYLKLSRSKVYLLVTQGQIPYVRIGRNVRIRETDLKMWIEENAVSPPIATKSL
jgi:excisionase family DNA binding protein